MVIMATTAREKLSQLLLLKLMLSQDIIIMVTLMVTAMDTAIMVTMARGRQRLPLDTIIMDILMAMVAMDTTVMDTTVNKQHLFISFQNSVTFIGTCWNLVNRNTHLEKKYKKSFYEIKKNK